MLTATSHAFGQQLGLRPSELTDYEAVRLRAPALSPQVIVGKVIDSDSTRLVLRQREHPPLTVWVRDIQHVEVMIGKDQFRTGVIGFAAGALAAGFGFKLYADAKYRNDELNAFGALFMAAPIGGLAGAAVAPRSGMRSGPRSRLLRGLAVTEWGRGVSACESRSACPCNGGRSGPDVEQAPAHCV